MSGHENQPAHPRKLFAHFLQKKEFYLCCVLILTVTVVFLPSLRNDFINYDDPEYVTDNPHVQNGWTLEGIRWAFFTTAASNWHPLTWLSHMTDCQLFGQKSWGHHLTSVILHALNSGLLFLVLRGMTGALWRSMFVACLFGLHPLHVQSVAWVSERKDVLSTFFYFLTLWAYIKYADRRGNRESGEWRVASGTESRSRLTSGLVAGGKHSAIGFYLLTVVFFGLGLMSKPMVVTLPFVLLLLDYWPLDRMQPFRSTGPPSPAFWQRRPELWNLTLEKIPFFALAVAASAVTFLVQKDSGAMRGLTGTFSLAARLDNALVGYCLYLGKFFYPLKLAAFYPRPSAWPAIQVALGAGLLLGISAAAFWMRRRRPYLLVGWLWYIGTLVPVIGLVQVGAQSIADRYTYIPLIGVLLMLVWGIHDLTSQWHYQGSKLVVPVIIVLLLCAVVTRWQIGFWSDSETLFRRALSVTHDNALARLNLGVALGEKGRPEEALEELKAAIRLVPDDPDLMFTIGKAMLGLGYPVEAIILLQESLAIDPAQTQCHMALARALEKTGHLDEAILHYREAVRLKPELLDARNDLGLALCIKTQFEDAIDQFKQALILEPNSPETHNFLGFALAQANRTDEAISQFRYAIKLKPDFAEAYGRLGVVFLTGGQFDEAIQQFRQALALNPNYADAYVNLGVALFHKGDLDEAAEQFRRALALEPNYVLAQKNLDLLISRKRSSVPP